MEKKTCSETETVVSVSTGKRYPQREGGGGGSREAAIEVTRHDSSAQHTLDLGATHSHAPLLQTLQQHLRRQNLVLHKRDGNADLEATDCVHDSKFLAHLSRHPQVQPKSTPSPPEYMKVKQRLESRTQAGGDAGQGSEGTASSARTSTKLSLSNSTSKLFPKDAAWSKGF